VFAHKPTQNALIMIWLICPLVRIFYHFEPSISNVALQSLFPSATADGIDLKLGVSFALIDPGWKTDDFFSSVVLACFLTLVVFVLVTAHRYFKEFFNVTGFNKS
jgi:hypothetical protein